MVREIWLSKNNNNNKRIIREKAFLEMKKDVGMTTAQKSKETRRMKWDQSLFCTSSQQSLHVRTLLHYNLKLPDIYVGNICRECWLDVQNKD